MCDVEERCTGTSTTCPADGFAPASTMCRASAGPCDAVETCTGSSATCPADGFAGSSTECRPAAGACDVAETCSGTSASCPSDMLRPSSYTCRGSAGVCDVAETCSGTSTGCPSDRFASSSTTCRMASGVCDLAETCDGTSAGCPSNSYAPATTVCRMSAGMCDLAENCTGSSGGCPADAFASSSTVCRAAAGGCDIAENCPGGSAACPTNAFVASGTDPSNACGTYVCNGSGSCFTSCSGCNTNCDSSSQCTTGVCSARLADGASCSTACQCSSNMCASFHMDSDADTYGAGASSFRCGATGGGAPSGWTTDGTDCNDSNAAIHPGVAELCNTIDEDCDSAARNTCPSASATVGSAGAGANCGPGVNGTSTAFGDTCPAGTILMGYNVYSDGTYVQGLQGVCSPVTIVESPGSPEYSYRLAWSGSTTTLTFHGNMTGTLNMARCPTDQYLIGYDTRQSGALMTAFGFRCGSLAYTRSGSTWVPRMTAGSTLGPFGSASGTGCSISCSGDMLLTVADGRTTTAGGPTGVLQSIYVRCSTLGYVPQ